MTPKQKTLAMILSGALVAVAPSFFGYLQARQEIREKYRKSHAEAEAGYAALADSVKELQTVATTQHDYIVKLEGQVSVLTVLAQATPAADPTPHTGTHPVRPTGHGTGTGGGIAKRSDVPKLDKPPPRPNFNEPPNDFGGAVQMKRKR
jgi:hypothetical protein